MKDILKIMWFDFLTAKPIALGGMVFTVLFFGILSMLFSPIIAAYITFGAMTFVIPLQSVADKSGFHKLYGILPVERRNITRARFLYVYLVHFLTELLELLIVCIAKGVRLYRLFPNQESEMMQMVQESFADTRLTLLMVFGIFTLLCLLFSYMEMMGQIFGRESEMKIILITMAIISVLMIAFFTLSDKGIIPTIHFPLPQLPEHVPGVLLLGAGLNIVMLGLCMLFSEITANQLAKREL